MRSGKKARKEEKKIAAAKSCWGCGDDWKERWEPEDLADEVSINDSAPEHTLCPDCYTELVEAGSVED